MFNKNKVCRGFLDGVCPECPLFLFREHLLNAQPGITEVMMRYRCEGCKTEFKFGPEVNVDEPMCLVCDCDIQPMPDTPPDRLDAIRKKAEALGVDSELFDDWQRVYTNANWLLGLIEDKIAIIENQRQDRKEDL
jgi:hypothetical protein